jgi:hypothetical protein
MWLAILAGIVGFALVRSMVVESAAGPRPGGVLSQITSLNAQRRGTAAVAPTGDGGTMLGALRSIGGKAAGLGRKLNPFRRG